MEDNQDFEDFKKYFAEYQERFGLNGYKVYLNYGPLNSKFAEIMVDQESMVATVCLNSKLSAKDKLHKNIRRSAKHEAIHLLLHRLEDRARFRYVTQTELYETVEELVFKLEKLIGEVN